jgi:hypothetical protein
VARSLLLAFEEIAMNAEIKSAWIDRFVMRLSRLQVDSSTDMLVDTAFSRWVGLRNLQPEVAAQIEYSECPQYGVDTARATS